jgi:peptidoglycan hydrolase CwlO-like protein
MNTSQMQLHPQDHTFPAADPDALRPQGGHLHAGSTSPETAVDGVSVQQNHKVMSLQDSNQKLTETIQKCKHQKEQLQNQIQEHETRIDQLSS